MNKGRYRSEIDGLRAVAVLTVVLFHAGLCFPGGYIGVDVFFVISGFLITGILQREMQSGEFRLIHFWERRIRRISPALVVMTLSTLATGAIVLLPVDFIALAKSALFQPIMGANFHFRDCVGYFSGPAELIPLLHTWSLAVEEQFYLAFPVLLIIWNRLSGKSLQRYLWSLAVASFAFSIWGTQAFPDSTFYLLPGRAWELLAGAILAVSHPSILHGPVSRSVISWIGLGGILLGTCCYTTLTPFPGFNALLPCAGAVCFIYGNSCGLTSAGRLLAIGPMVLIGKMSYSLYLWHWPVLSLLRHLYGVDLPAPVSLYAVTISLALGWGSWKFIETPFRRPTAMSPRGVFSLATLSSLLIVAVSVGIIQGNGFSNRFSPKVLEIIASGSAASRFLSDHIEQIGAPLPADDTGSFLLWGDSHAIAIHEMIHELALENGVSGYSACRPGMAPVPGTWNHYQSSHDTLLWNTKVIEFARSKDIRHVILAARWKLYVDGVKNGSTNTMLLDNSSSVASPEESRKVLDRGLRALLDEFESVGATVWLMQQVPEQNVTDTPIQLARCYSYNRPFEINGVSRKEHLATQANVNGVLEKLPQQQVRIIDPTDNVFDNAGFASLCRGEVAHYSDSNHLSRAGAKMLLSDLFEPVMHEIAESKANLARRPESAPALLKTAVAEDNDGSIVR